MPGTGRRQRACADARRRAARAFACAARRSRSAACCRASPRRASAHPAAAAAAAAAEPPPRRRRSAPARSGSALILPLSAQGNAGVAAQSMKNAAEMALAEFNSPNIQLLVKDDGGTPQGAQHAAQQALDEGAEIILGPLFAQSVSAVGAGRAPAQHSGDRVLDRRQRRGARRLSAELPAGVRRRPHRRLRHRRSGKRSFAALLPDNAYGTVVEAAFQQEVRAPRRPHRRARALSARSRASIAGAGRAASRRRRRSADAIFIPDGADVGAAGGAGARRPPASTSSACSCSAPACGTIRASSRRRRCTAAGIAAPDPTGFRNFSARYRAALRPGSGAHRDARL